MQNRDLFDMLWKSCHIMPNRLQELKSVADKIVGFRVAYYDPVETTTQIPWWVVGAIDCREENFDHTCYLGNGDPLNKPTRDVPRGRGPFNSWFEGAIDALKLDDVDKIPFGGKWDAVTALMKCELYNGLGYSKRGLPSPYVWGATNQQKPGKFVADGRFDPHDWDEQPGCAAIFLALKQFHAVDIV